MSVDVKITPIKKENEKLYKKVISTFMTLIEKGELEYGDKLYNEEELIKKLNVSRSTLREALRVLEFMDILTVAPKKGIVINNPSDRIDYPPLKFILQFEKIPKREIVSLRLGIESHAAHDAINNLCDEDIKNLLCLKEELMREDDLHKIIIIDKKIHDYIIELSQNRTLIKLYNTFSDLFAEQLTEAVKNTYKDDKNNELIGTHCKMIDSIIDKDLQGILAMLQKHFNESLRRYLE
jgi:GntR family transcriptional repressor for pyruvate dehydrogenase complex